MRFSDEARAQLRAGLMTRGRSLAAMLADVLAGKRPPSLAELVMARPGKRPEEVLREALAQVEARRTLLDAGDDRFGRCDTCGADLGEAALREMPWADRCALHRTSA